MPPRQLDDLFAGIEDAARPLDDFLASGSQLHPLGCTLDELHTEVLLELLELRRQRRLAHEAAFGRAAEVARIGHCHQVTQVLELEVRHRCPLSSLSNQSIGRNTTYPGECAPSQVSTIHSMEESTCSVSDRSFPSIP
jgi:hypothetical protein